jgi:ribosomal protein S17
MIEGTKHAGDVVQIEECAPISKTKAWRVRALWRKHANLIFCRLHFDRQN